MFIYIGGGIIGEQTPDTFRGFLTNKAPTINSKQCALANTQNTPTPTPIIH